MSEALNLADKYDISVARSRLRLSLVEFAKKEPLRVYAIARRLGLEDEMRIASSHSTSIHLPELTELPDEFRFIPATEYHRLIRLHSRYRKEVEAIARSIVGMVPRARGFSGMMEAIELDSVLEDLGGDIKGIPLNHKSFKLAMNGVDLGATDLESIIRCIFESANSLNLTVQLQHLYTRCSL